ncbi:aldo/keto reductase, partial [Lachnoclostridium sp.]
MNYRNPNRTDSLSILGFGCLRFPKKGKAIDMEETEREILYAIEHGINYFDTAYIYSGSEEALGTILQKHNCREKVMIATKLPHYLIKKAGDIDRFFDEQLKRLKTDYIDYYLMHMLPDVNIWNRLIDLGILEWLESKKQAGIIKRIGFSYHGNTAAFQELLDAYPWDFCQIQYNYMDEQSQAGVAGLKKAASKNIPVIIMEPLRGGR